MDRRTGVHFGRGSPGPHHEGSYDGWSCPGSTIALTVAICWSAWCTAAASMRLRHKSFPGKEEEIADPILRERLEWVESLAPGLQSPADTPFTAEQLPEVIGSLLAMSHINRFSHVVMAGSPLKAPLGFQRIKSAALRMSDPALKTTTERPIQPGRGSTLLPPAPLPDDMYWAEPNPRIASALSRWAEWSSVNQHSSSSRTFEISFITICNAGKGEPMPISRSWVDKEVDKGLTGRDCAIARFALVLAKAPYQVDEALVGEILREDRDETRFIRILAWASFSAARRIAKESRQHS